MKCPECGEELEAMRCPMCHYQGYTVQPKQAKDISDGSLVVTGCGTCVCRDDYSTTSFCPALDRICAFGIVLCDKAEKINLKDY